MENVEKVGGWREAREEEVCSMLERHRPESLFFLNYVKGSLKWSSRRPDIKTRLFRPEGPEWDGSLVIDVKGHVYGVAVFWPYEDYSFLLLLLKRNDIIDWRRKPKIIFGIPKQIFEPFEQTVRSHGVEITATYTLHTFLMPAERARQLTVSIPEGFLISKLDQSHASLANRMWPSARQQSLKLIEDMIDINHTVGLFIKEDSKLVSWILNTYYGLGMLHTVPDYRRKGYGSLLAKILSKTLGEEGTDVIVMARDTNISSQLLFKNIGFESLSILKVIQTCKDAKKY